MCQACFHARKAANPRIVPVTPKAEKKVTCVYVCVCVCGDMCVCVCVW